MRASAMLIVAVLAACVAISAAQGAAGPAAQPPNPPVVTDPLVAAQLLAAAEVDARLFKEIVPVANSDNSTSYPVIDIGPECAIECRDLPAVLTVVCTTCLFASGKATTWPTVPANGSAVRVMSRLPLAEVGYTAQFSIPLLLPLRWTVDILQPGGAFQLLGGIFSNAQWGPALPSGVTVCNPALVGEPGANATGCMTRDYGGTLGAGSFCVVKPGWINPGVPSCSADIKTYSIPFNDPSQLGVAVANTQGRKQFVKTSIARSVAMYSTVDAATDSLWAAANYAWQSAVFLRNVTGARIDAVAALYGAEFTAAMRADAQKGALVEIDLTSMQGLQPASGAWSPSAHVLLRIKPPKSGRVTFDGLLIRLSNAPADPNAAAVFSPQKSETGWILACAIARTAIAQWSTWIGHVYHMHQTTGAIAYALYATIEPGVPVGQAKTVHRLLADHFLDPTYLQEFMGGLFAGVIRPPPTPFSVSELPQMYERYATTGGPTGAFTGFMSALPSSQIAASGLDPAAFVGKNKKVLFGAYPLVAFQQSIRPNVEAFATGVINAYYASDAAVAADTAVQQFAAALVDPKGGNLGKINQANELKTRAQLATFWADTLQLLLLHSVAHLQDYGVTFGVPSFGPGSLGTQTLPNPTATFTMQQLMDYAPLMDNTQSKYQFMTTFISAQPFTQFVPSKNGKPGGPPVWDGGSPFPTDATGKKATKALVALRRAISNGLASWPVDGVLRLMRTNYQQPTRIPRVCDL